MKIIWRTLIILLAAAVVTAGTMGAMQLPAVQSWIGSQGGERHGPPAGMTDGEFAQAPTFAASAATSAAGDTDDATAASGQQAPPMRGENGGRSGGNLLGLLEVVKNLVVVVAVSLAIAAVGWFARRLAPKRHAPAATV